MGNQLVKSVSGIELAENLGLQFEGDPNANFNHVVQLSRISDQTLTFSKSKCVVDSDSVVIAPNDSIATKGMILYSHNPRLDFCRALLLLESQPGFTDLPSEPTIHPTAKIGKYVDFGKGVKIGAHSEIASFSYIGDDVWIGENCKIRTGAIIGEEGYGFERDEASVPIRMPHLGGVRIGNNVLVGAATTVCRGTLNHTIIQDFAKIDDHVHIAHNCKIESKAMVVACAEVSGGVNVKEGAWVGPNSSVIQQLTIGANALVGLGATVIRSVDDNDIVAGNPAKSIKK